MDLADRSAELRQAHRDAIEALNRGCSEDLTLLARLVHHPLREAGEELKAKLDALGSLEPFLRGNIVAELADETAVHCVRKVAAMADVRFRARFGAYASAVAHANETLSHRAHASVRLPRLDFDDDIRMALTDNVSSTTIDQWVEALDRHLRSQLKRAVGRARQALINRGFASLARMRLSLRAAAHERVPRIGPPT